ncbi:MAG: glycoside hydrolase family 2, partial [Kiritimatiellae bacterium]|nr:glycoside hydrolase family 2 [Kiritimatiellia bacterium]
RLPAPGREQMLTVSFALAEDTPWAKKGHIIAWDQMPLNQPPMSTVNRPADGSAPKVSEAGGRISVSGDGYEAVFDRALGALVSYRIDGREWLSGPMWPNFWRPPTDNDRGNGMANWARVWRAASRERTVEECTVATLTGGAVRIATRYAFPAAGETRAQVSYDVHPGGGLEVTMRLEPKGEKLPMLPRVGLQTRLAGALEPVRWYGRGPHENYSDRKTGAAVGRYEATVDELITHYSEPGENGHRTDIRWLELRAGDAARGLRVRGFPMFEFSAWPHAAEDIEGPSHPHRVPGRDFVTLNLDAGQMGVGGDNSWGARAHPPYCLPADRVYEHRIWIEPFS